MQPNELDLWAIIANKAPNYDSLYDLFPQFLFKNGVKELQQEMKTASKTRVFSQSYLIEDFEDINTNEFQDNPLYHPRFFYNTTVYPGQKKANQAPPVSTSMAPPPVPTNEHLKPEKVIYNDWTETTSEPADSVGQPPIGSTTTAEGKKGGRVDIDSRKPLPGEAEASKATLDNERQVYSKLELELEEARLELARMREEKERLLKERDPAIIAREEEETRRREQEEIEQRRIREEAERMEKERLRRLEEERIEKELREERRRLAEEKRQREEAIERLNKKREEFYQAHRMEDKHFTYYNPQKMAVKDLYTMYKFSLTDPTLTEWQDTFRTEIQNRSRWMLAPKLQGPELRLRLAFDPKYSELGILHHFVGKMARYRKYYMKHDLFPRKSMIKEQFNQLEAFHNS